MGRVSRLWRIFPNRRGFDPSKLETQLDFRPDRECELLSEGLGGDPERRSYYPDIIPVFVASYENPADHQKEIDAAMGFANAWWSDVEQWGPMHFLSSATPKYYALRPLSLRRRSLPAR